MRERESARVRERESERESEREREREGERASERARGLTHMHDLARMGHTRVQA